MQLISTLNRILNKKTPLTKDEIEYALEFEDNQKKYNKLKEEFKKVRNKDKLSERLKIFIFLASINFADNETIKTLLNSVKKSKLPKAKVALGRLYFRTNNFLKAIEFYSEVFDKSFNSFHSRDLKYYLSSLKKLAHFQKYEQVLAFLLKKYPNDRSLQIEALIHQVTMLHKNPQNLNAIKNNLNFIVKNLKSFSELFTLGYLYYNAGFLKQSFHAYDLFYKNLKVENTKKKFKSDLKVTDVKDSLNEILEIIESENHQGFLIGGTLLGFIRDGDILEHDKDADIGLFIEDFETIYQLVSKICEKPHFIASYMVDKPKEFLEWNVAIFDTKRKTVTDLFFFRKMGDKVGEGIWTRHSTIKWVFTPFNLKRVNYHGYDYYIPENPELYLEELFGDWRKPVKVWDSLLDCPNLTPDSKNGSIYYALQRLYGTVEERNPVKFKNYLKGLKKWGFEFSKDTEKNLDNILKELEEKK